MDFWWLIDGLCWYFSGFVMVLLVEIKVTKSIAKLKSM